MFALTAATAVVLLAASLYVLGAASSFYARFRSRLSANSHRYNRLLVVIATLMAAQCVLSGASLLYRKSRAPRSSSSNNIDGDGNGSSCANINNSGHERGATLRDMWLDFTDTTAHVVTDALIRLCTHRLLWLRVRTLYECRSMDRHRRYQLVGRLTFALTVSLIVGHVVAHTLLLSYTGKAIDKKTIRALTIATYVGGMCCKLVLFGLSVAAVSSRKLVCARLGIDFADIAASCTRLKRCALAFLLNEAAFIAVIALPSRVLPVEKKELAPVLSSICNFAHLVVLIVSFRNWRLRLLVGVRGGRCCCCAATAVGDNSELPADGDCTLGGGGDGGGGGGVEQGAAGNGTDIKRGGGLWVTSTNVQLSAQVSTTRSQHSQVIASCAGP